MDKDKLIQDLIRKVEDLTIRVQQLETFKQENKKLHQEISLLKAENAELKSQLNSNSRNSSKPPSSDGFKKKPALPKKGKGKQGGQTGHQGHTLQQVKHPNKVVDCMPEHCTCGHYFLKEQMTLSETRQVFDLPQPKLEITEFRIHKAICPVCGLENKAEAPAGVNAPAQYGNGVKAYAVLLNVHFKLPFKKIQLLFNDLFGYPINESTVCSATGQCYQKLEESEEIIKSTIVKNHVVHADETGLRVAGKLHWLHTATTLDHTYLFVHKRRGRQALESDKSILSRITGWLVHDCWSSYFKFKKFKHAICGAHILRELEGLIENGQSRWAKTFKAFLMNVYEMPFEDRVKRRQQIESRYSHICKIGNQQELPPIKLTGKRGRYKRTKGRNLVERLIREKNAVLTFAFNKQVPFTNNLAERDIRPSKVKQKISNCFRTLSGAEIYARIEGFISTARKQNQNVFSELCATFEGSNFLTGKVNS